MSDTALAQQARDDVAIYRERLAEMKEGDRWLGLIASEHLLDLIERMAAALSVPPAPPDELPPCDCRANDWVEGRRCRACRRFSSSGKAVCTCTPCPECEAERGAVVPPAPHEEGDDSEMTPEDEAAHHEFVREVAAEHGFPLSDWQPAAVPPAPDERLPATGYIPGFSASPEITRLPAVPPAPAGDVCENCEAGRGNIHIETADVRGPGWKCPCGWWNWLPVVTPVGPVVPLVDSEHEETDE